MVEILDWDSIDWEKVEHEQANEDTTQWLAEQNPLMSDR